MQKVHFEKDNVSFYCPGCDGFHVLPVTEAASANGHKWKFNGDIESPTLNPSVLVAKDEPSRRCHLYVRDGKIQYLSDCHHDLKGKTVPMWEIKGEPNPDGGTSLYNITENQMDYQKEFKDNIQSIKAAAEEVNEFIKETILKNAALLHFGIENNEEWQKIMDEDPQQVFNMIKDHGFDVSIEPETAGPFTEDGKTIMKSIMKVKFVRIKNETHIETDVELDVNYVKPEQADTEGAHDEQ